MQSVISQDTTNGRRIYYSERRDEPRGPVPRLPCQRKGQASAAKRRWAATGVAGFHRQAALGGPSPGPPPGVARSAPAAAGGAGRPRRLQAAWGDGALPCLVMRQPQRLFKSGSFQYLAP